MTYRTRIKYTAKQKDEMWYRWQRGESLKYNQGQTTFLLFTISRISRLR